MIGRHVIHAYSGPFGGTYMRPELDGDLDDIVVWFQPDGTGTTANMDDSHVGDWWVMELASLGPQQYRSYSLCRTEADARGKNYYYHDYRATFTVHPDLSITWATYNGPHNRPAVDGGDGVAVRWLDSDSEGEG